MGVDSQCQAPATLHLRKRHNTHCIGRWVGRRAGLDGCKKTTNPGFDSRTFQPGILKSGLRKTAVVY